MKFIVMIFCVLIAHGAAAETILSHGRFESVHVHAPTRVANQFVIVLASANLPDTAPLVAAMNAQGALVAVVDTARFLAQLQRDGSECVSPDGDLENLSHYIQASQRLTTYHAPMLVGVGAGATFVYAMLAQAPKDTFGGGISLLFCPDLALRKPLCKDERLDYEMGKNGGVITLAAANLERSWQVIDTAACPNAHAFAAKVDPEILHTSSAQMSRQALFERIYADLAQAVAPTVAPPPEQVADLPLIEVPTQRGGDTFAVMLSGDGGWAGLDKDVAAAVAERGIPVVGVDSLRYFWSERNAEGLARDLERIVRTYMARWHRTHMILIGYSQGADVLPFALNQLEAETRAALRATVMIGLAERAQFEFHVGNWLGLDEDEGLPIEPQVRRLKSPPALICIYGDDDEDARCDAFKHVNSAIKVIKLDGGHHFDGDYEGLARVIVESALPVIPAEAGTHR